MSDSFDQDCVFCKIIQGQLPCEKIYENDQVIVFNDINPKAKTHWLVVPKLHIESLHRVEAQHKPLLGEMAWTISHLALAHQIGDYRVAINTGKGAGQVVFHIHWHVLSGAASLENL